jgi:hypothetical protein
MTLPTFHEGIQLGPINLDGMTDSELAEAALHPALHLDVRAYARTQIEARKARLSGDIVKAMKLENVCERVYATIPTKLRW